MEKVRGIRYFPIALFASVMGLSGVSISVKLFENIFNTGHITSTLLIFLASIAFIVNGFFFVYRLIRYKNDVQQEFNHPVKMYFYAAISISLLLLSVLYYEISSVLSYYIWLIGTVLQVGFTLSILSKLIWKTNFQITQFNPAWFIPIVGNLVVPLAGVYHVGTDINWMFFSIGMLFSIIYMAIFVFRVFFHPPLPEKLLPTFFIILAPPGVGTVGYMKLAGDVDIFAYITYGIAIYLGLLLIFQFKRFFTIRFFLSWWAFLFPSAAVTIASAYMYLETDKTYYQWIFIVQLLALVMLTIYLIWRTLGLVLNRSLCIKEENPKTQEINLQWPV